MKNKLRKLLLSLSALALVFGGVFAVSGPAFAADGTPILSGSSWFGGHGVNVCSNSTSGSDTTCGGETQTSNVAGAYWQCVEMAQRFYYAQGWYSSTHFAGISAAYQIYDNAASLGMTRQANGSISSIVPGDMIIHGSTDPYSPGAGHVAIVDTVSGSTVNVVEQNGSSTGRASYSLSNGTLTRGSDVISGVVHSPANTGSADTDADGTPDSSDVLPTVAGPSNNRGAPLQPSRLSGDFNGDGKQDIAMFYNYGSGQTKLLLYVGDGAGGFAWPSVAWDSGINSWEWGNMKPVVGDFNGDGKTDIAVFYDYGSGRTKIWMFFGSSSGTFASPTLEWDSGAGNQEWNHGLPVVGDFNGDGHLDIAQFYDYAGETKLLLYAGNGTGSFAWPSVAWDSGPGNWRWQNTKPVVGDFNADGKTDIAAFYDYGGVQTKVWTFFGSSAGTFASPTLEWDSGVGNNEWTRLTAFAGDFNGDGKTDTAFSYDYGLSTGKLFTLYGDGAGNLATPVVTWDSGAGNWDWTHAKPVVGDFNGDGKTDIAAFYDYGSSGVKILEFNGSSSGNFTWPSETWYSGVGNMNWPNILTP